MSFSDNVRQNIRGTINDHDKRFACLYAMLLFSRTLTKDEICLKSESEILDSVFPILMKTIFGARVPLQVECKPRKDGSVLRIYRITGREAVTKIRSTFHIHELRRIDMRNAAIQAGQADPSDYFVDAGLMEKVNALFVPPTEEELPGLIIVRE